MGAEEFLNIEEEHKREFSELLQYCLASGRIDQNLYQEYDVKRGLRDSAGKGVLTGLTEISDVTGYKLVNGRRIPADGELYYQGINVQDIVNGLKDRRFGFEETIYLLIFGKLPSKDELSRFLELLSDMEDLGGRFVRDVVMKGTNANIMNAMERCVLALYTYDDNPENISVENVLRQSLELIAKLPEIAVYSYHAYRHFRKDETLFIRNPQKGLSLAENILLMLRPDGKYTELEAKVLDIALVLHAEHGGGNNSTFTTHVVTSSGTDSYSSTAASIGSLKENGEFLLYAPYSFLLTLYHETPDSFFGGGIWSVSLASGGEELLGSDNVARAREKIIRQYENSLQDVITFAENQYSDATTLQRVKLSIEFLRKEMVE